ncbi:MAG: HAD-IC family P-type ATPase, partial [Candidatus Muiribacteriaceae bacterium]
TRPVEQAMGTVENIQAINSTSSEGSSVVMAQFDFGTDMDVAALEIRERVDMINALLPEDSSSPMVLKVDIDAQPIIQISVSGSDYIAGNERLIMERELEWGKFRTLSEKEREKGKTVVHIADSEKVLGLLCVRDEPRKGIHNVISGFKKMGIKVYMLTGDNERTASAIAKEIGIDEVYSELLPHNKSDIVKKLSENSITAMVGDGINDAPSLAVADIGIAMGGGTDVAIESGDVVLMRDEPASLISAYRISGLTVRKIMQNMFWALIYNTLGIPVAAGVLYPFTGWLLNPMFAGGAMALSSVSVVVSSLLLKYKKI